MVGIDLKQAAVPNLFLLSHTYPHTEKKEKHSYSMKFLVIGLNFFEHIYRIMTTNITWREGGRVSKIGTKSVKYFLNKKDLTHRFVRILKK